MDNDFKDKKIDIIVDSVIDMSIGTVSLVTASYKEVFTGGFASDVY